MNFKLLEFKDIKEQLKTFKYFVDEINNTYPIEILPNFIIPDNWTYMIEYAETKHNTNFLTCSSKYSPYTLCIPLKISEKS